MSWGVVMLLDVVMALGGGVVPTLRHGATTLRVGASTVGGFVCCPAMIAVSSWMARMCLILLADNFGTVPPNTLRKSAATAMERSCCKVLDLAVGWVQAPGVGEAEAARCRNVESEVSVVVEGGSDVEAIGCMGHPGCL
jgi:hypothetical protein